MPFEWTLGKLARVKGDPHIHDQTDSPKKSRSGSGSGSGSRPRSAKARGRHQPASQPSQQPSTLLSKGLNTLQLGGGFLMIAALVIGPLLAGSYYEPWRWPLIYTSSAAAALLILSTRPKTSLNWVLLALLIWPVIQGIWMYYNAWGEFSRTRYYDPTYLPWRITQLDDQPFPSLPGAADKAEAFDRLSFILPCLGLIWGTRQLVVARPSWLMLIAKSIFWSGMVVAIIGLLQRTTGATAILWLDELDQGLLRKYFFATYRSPGIATCYLNVALALGLSCTLNALRSGSDEGSKKSKLRARFPMAYLLVTMAALIIIICAVITAGSKAGMALGVLTIILWSIFNRRSISSAFNESTSQIFFGNKAVERNIFFGALICITAFLLLSFAGLMSERWVGAHKLNYGSLTGRIQANEVMLKMVADDGWGAMGNGPGSFYPLFPFYTQEIDSMIMGVWVYAHNDYLQTLVEWGWLGTGCLAACIGGGYLLLTREVFFHRNDHSKSRFVHLRAYLVAMTIFLMHALIEFPFQIESLAVVFSVVLGVAWSVAELRGRDIRSRSINRFRGNGHRHHYEKPQR